ncbi:YciI family protein [Hyphobacterium sp.]|jgi:uncharacterized protein YciI|uniref:YciI family protein n=1 Tax=Hyphobacterium sp. TaxID=2004662 RepID=UPI003BAC9E27
MKVSTGRLRSVAAGLFFVLGIVSPVAAAAQETAAPFAGFESPYYVFQFGPGENWIEGRAPFEQDLAGHFAYMGQLASEGVLVHGGPLDRGDGSHAMGVIRADNLAHAHEIMAQDPALQADVYRLLALDRWIALAGSGDGIDASEVVGPGSP